MTQEERIKQLEELAAFNFVLIGAMIGTFRGMIRNNNLGKRDKEICDAFINLMTEKISEGTVNYQSLEQETKAANKIISKQVYNQNLS